MENWPQGYQEKIEEIMGTAVTDGETRLSFNMENEAEAKLLTKKLILMQKQLRQVKKEANAEMKSIQSNYGDQIKSVEAGFLSSIFGGEGRERENQRRQLRQKREEELIKYQNVKSTIDNILLQIDGAKLQIEELIMKGAFDD